jgi:adenylate cyclase class 2
MKQYKLTQRVLKIGDRAGVTLPAKRLKAMGIQPGDYVELTVTKHSPELHDAAAMKSVTQRLKELGAIFKGEFHYKRYVFDTHPAVKSRWIRLRTDGTQTTLTAKEIQNDTTTGTSEWEVEVSDLETTLTILEKIGIKPKSVQENYRLLFLLKEDEVTIDFWPELRPYVEIESSSAARIEQIAELLGFTKNDITGLNTQGLYAAKNINLDDVKELVFEQKPKEIELLLKGQ